MPVEREIKLRFGSAAEARDRVLAAGARPLRSRRRQIDTLFDTPDSTLFERRSALRVRMDGDRSFVTFKGPVQPGVLKTREELETAIADAGTLVAILEALGFRPRFRYEKYREEFEAANAVLAVDETPAGVFVEIEGEEGAVHALAQALDRTTRDYITDSYLALLLKHGTPGVDIRSADQPERGEA